jgi:MFS family permease
MTTSHAWWAVIFGRVLTGIGAAGLYAALPVAAEIMAEVSSGQATSETVLPWVSRNDVQNLKI